MQFPKLKFGWPLEIRRISCTASRVKGQRSYFFPRLWPLTFDPYGSNKPSPKCQFENGKFKLRSLTIIHVFLLLTLVNVGLFWWFRNPSSLIQLYLYPCRGHFVTTKTYIQVSLCELWALNVLLRYCCFVKLLLIRVMCALHMSYVSEAPWPSSLFSCQWKRIFDWNNHDLHHEVFLIFSQE